MSGKPKASPDGRMIRIRTADHEALGRKSYPVATIDLITAMRFLWEGATEKQRLEALRQVQSQQPGELATA